MLSQEEQPSFTGYSYLSQLRTQDYLYANDMNSCVYLFIQHDGETVRMKNMGEYTNRMRGIGIHKGTSVPTILQPINYITSTNISRQYAIFQWPNSLHSLSQTLKNAQPFESEIFNVTLVYNFVHQIIKPIIDFSSNNLTSLMSCIDIRNLWISQNFTQLFFTVCRRPTQKPNDAANNDSLRNILSKIAKVFKQIFSLQGVQGFHNIHRYKPTFLYFLLESMQKLELTLEQFEQLMSNKNSRKKFMQSQYRKLEISSFQDCRLNRQNCQNYMKKHILISNQLWNKKKYTTVKNGLSGKRRSLRQDNAHFCRKMDDISPASTGNISTYSNLQLPPSFVSSRRKCWTLFLRQPTSTHNTRTHKLSLDLNSTDRNNCSRQKQPTKRSNNCFDARSSPKTMSKSRERSLEKNRTYLYANSNLSNYRYHTIDYKESMSLNSTSDNISKTIKERAMRKLEQHRKVSIDQINATSLGIERDQEFRKKFEDYTFSKSHKREQLQKNGSLSKSLQISHNQSKEQEDRQLQKMKQNLFATIDWQVSNREQTQREVKTRVQQIAKQNAEIDLADKLDNKNTVDKYQAKDIQQVQHEQLRVDNSQQSNIGKIGKQESPQNSQILQFIPNQLPQVSFVNINKLPDNTSKPLTDKQQSHIDCPSYQKKMKKDKQDKLQKMKTPPLPPSRRNSFVEKAAIEDDEIEEIQLGKSKLTKKQTARQVSISKEEPQEKQKEVYQKENSASKQKNMDNSSDKRVNTNQSSVASSSGPNKPVAKQVNEYLYMINKMGQAVSKTSKLGPKLKEVEWFTGIYFVYKRFLFERKKIEKWLTVGSGPPVMTRYPAQPNETEWAEWLASSSRTTLLQTIKTENENIVKSIITMNKKIMKKQLPGNYLPHATLNKHSQQESKIAVSEVVGEFDALDQLNLLEDVELLAHANGLVNSLYIIGELDGKIEEKKPLSQILKARNKQELEEIADFVYDLYLTQ